MFNRAEMKIIVKALLEGYIADNEALRNFTNEPAAYLWTRCGKGVDGEYKCFRGETKGVLVPEDDNLDFVIKFPFDDDEYGFDYMRAEWRNYLKAKEAQLDEFFAETMYLGEFANASVYIQSKCYADYDMISQHIGSTMGYNRRDCGDSNDVAAYLDDTWEDYDLFNDFCFDNNINDIHAGNIAFVNEDSCQIVVIDYSGYCDVAFDFDEGNLADDYFDICGGYGYKEVL